MFAAGPTTSSHATPTRKPKRRRGGRRVQAEPRRFSKKWTDNLIAAAASAAKGPVGLRVAALMTERGYTESELARRSGVEQPRISDIVCGRAQYAYLSRLAAIAEALGTTVDELLVDVLPEGMTVEQYRQVAASASAEPKIRIN